MYQKVVFKRLRNNIASLYSWQPFASASQSVRDNMNTTLTKKFVDEMKTYQQTQQQYKTDIKKKVKRQVQVVKPDATDEEVDAVMKSEGGRDALYKQSILAGGVNDQIKYVLYAYTTLRDMVSPCFALGPFETNRGVSIFCHPAELPTPKSQESIKMSWLWNSL